MKNCTSEWMNGMAKGGSWIFFLCIITSIEMSLRNRNCAVSLRAKSMVTTKNSDNYESVKKNRMHQTLIVHSMLVAEKLLYRRVYTQLCCSYYINNFYMLNLSQIATQTVNISRHWFEKTFKLKPGWIVCVSFLFLHII